MAGDHRVKVIRSETSRSETSRSETSRSETSRSKVIRLACPLRDEADNHSNLCCSPHCQEGNHENSQE